MSTANLSPTPWRWVVENNGPGRWQTRMVDADGAPVDIDKCRALLAAAPDLLHWVRTYQDNMDDSEGELAALLARINGDD